MSTTTMTKMSTKEIAKKLKNLCDKGNFEGAHKELYSKDAVSIEPEASAGFAKETRGLNAIAEKGKKWNDMVSQTHSIEISDPLIAGNSFALTMRLDVTTKDKGRTDMTELCVYQVKNGEIVSEQFFM